MFLFFPIVDLKWVMVDFHTYKAIMYTFLTIENFSLIVFYRNIYNRFFY